MDDPVLLTPTPSVLEGGRPALHTALRRDPGHAADLVVLQVLPWMAPAVGRWVERNRTDETAERQSQRMVRESVGTARRAGAVTGSSFYIGIGPAIAAIYCEQLAMVLRVAALHGFDPGDPARAAELAVIQGRAETYEAAVDALRRAGSGTERSRTSVRSLLRELPAMIGLQLHRLRNPIDAALAVVEVASFVIPVVSIPVWTVANGRATRRLGQAAIRYYGGARPGEHPVAGVVPSPVPTTRRRRAVSIGLVALTVTLAVIAALFPLGHRLRLLPFGGRVLALFSLVASFAHLRQVTRPRRARRRS